MTYDYSTDPLTAPLDEVATADPSPVAVTRSDLGLADAPDEPLRRATPIEDAFGYAVDRLERLEHVLGNLNGVVMRAGVDLAPVLTGGEYPEPETRADWDDARRLRAKVRNGAQFEESLGRWVA